MLRRTFLLLAAALVASPLAAAPRPDDKPTGPAVIGQAKSLDDLLALFKTLVKNVAGEAAYKEFEARVFPELDPKQLPGIDASKPFGLYGLLADKIENCRGVVLIPVPNEKAFVTMLEEHRIELRPGRGAGTFDFVMPPDFPTTVHLRIHKSYAYIAVGGFDVLENDRILEPSAIIGSKETAALLLSFRLDRVPADAKKMLIGLMREGVDNLKLAMELEQAPKPAQESFECFERLAFRYVRLLLDECKEVALRIDADTKTGEVFADVTVEGLAKSPLASHIAARKPTTNAFSSLGNGEHVQRIFLSAPLFADEVKEGFGKLVDWAMVESKAGLAGGAGSPPEVIALTEAAFKSLKATIQSGDMDIAAVLRGPNKDGFYTAAAAIGCKETEPLEKAIRNAISVMDEKDRGMFKFDAGKIGDIKVHEIDLTSIADAKMLKALFGEGQTAYFAFGKSAIFLAYGPYGMKHLKDAVMAKPGLAPPFEASGDAKKSKELMEKIVAAEGNPGSVGFLESAAGGARITVTGGDKLRIRFGVNVAGMLQLFGLEAKPEGAQPVRVGK